MAHREGCAFSPCTMESTSCKDLCCWRVAVALVLALAVGANAFDRSASQDAYFGEVADAGHLPSRLVRSKPGRSNPPPPQPPAVSIVGPAYSSASASVSCALLNASANVTSNGKWYWTLDYPAAGTRGYVLTAVANKTIAITLPASLRGSIAVSEDNVGTTITLCNVQELRSHVNVSCLWKSSRGTRWRGSNAQPHTKSAILYGPPHFAGCWLELVSYTSASIDWLPLKSHGTIAPIDMYTLEVSHGAEIVQRVELSGTVGHQPLVLPNVLQPHTLYNATLFGNNSAGRGPPCHVSFATSEVASLAVQTCPVFEWDGHFYLIAAWKPRFPESLVSHHCGLHREGDESEVPLQSTRSQCAASQARLVPADNSSVAPGSYQMEVVESLSQTGVPVTQYTTRLTVDIDYVSASVEYIGEGVYLVTCELACQSHLTACVVYLNSSRTGSKGEDWDELGTVPVNAWRDMTQLDTTRPIAVWNFSLHGSCIECMGVQAVQNRKPIGEIKRIMVVYPTTTDCLEPLPPSSWASNEMDIITAVLFLFIVLICVPCCIAITALVIRSCYCQGNSSCRGHLHLSHSVSPTAATPNFRRYRPTPTEQPGGGEQQQQQGQNVNQAQDNDAHVMYVHRIDLEHVDNSYDCDAV